MAEIDPVEFGRLAEAMEMLKPELAALREEAAHLSERITELEQRYRIGKGVAFGILIGIGFAVYGVKQTLLKLAGVGS